MHTRNRYDEPFLFTENREDDKNRYGSENEDEEGKLPEFLSLLQANQGNYKLIKNCVYKGIF